MNHPSVVTVSLSKIGSQVLSEKLGLLQHESLGTLELKNFDLVEYEKMSFKHDSLVILNLPLWSANYVGMIEDLRRKSYNGPVLLVVKDLKLWNVDVLNPLDFRKVNFLEFPFSNEEIVGLVRRILALRTDSCRIHARYELDQAADVAYGEKIEAHQVCTVRNVSLGGACIEFQNEVPVQADHFITLLMSTGKPNEAHRIRSRIAWIQKQSALVGVEFMSGPHFG